MKKYLLALSIAFIAGCQNKPEFYINGKAYYTEKECIDGHTMVTTGVSTSGTVTTYSTFICDKWRIDTIAVKP